ncbi:MAG: hypothetical protein AAF902_01970 [Chloroflexota bacterium]
MSLSVVGIDDPLWHEQLTRNMKVTDLFAVRVVDTNVSIGIAVIFLIFQFHLAFRRVKTERKNLMVEWNEDFRVGTLKSHPSIIFSIQNFPHETEDRLMWGGRIEHKNEPIVVIPFEYESRYEACLALEDEFEEWCRAAMFGKMYVSRCF